MWCANVDPNYGLVIFQFSYKTILSVFPIIMLKLKLLTFKKKKLLNSSNMIEVAKIRHFYLYPLLPVAAEDCCISKTC